MFHKVSSERVHGAYQREQGYTAVCKSNMNWENWLLKLRVWLKGLRRHPCGPTRLRRLYDANEDMLYDIIHGWVTFLKHLCKGLFVGFWEQPSHVDFHYPISIWCLNLVRRFFLRESWPKTKRFRLWTWSWSSFQEFYLPDFTVIASNISNNDMHGSCALGFYGVHFFSNHGFKLLARICAMESMPQFDLYRIDCWVGTHFIGGFPGTFACSGRCTFQDW